MSRITALDHYVDLKDPNYFAIDTSFSIAFCVLYSQLVSYKDKHKSALPSYEAIALDVLKSVDEVHARGELKKFIVKHPQDYIHQDKEVVQGLKRYIRFRKKFFILTNSDYKYAQELLNYAITPFLEPNERWEDLFEHVITLARKPKFFYDNDPFYVINPTTGDMKVKKGKVTPGFYQGGNASQFTRDLNLLGDEILYIGDHIYGDILRLKKDCNWRTALVVEEIGQEIEAQIKAKPIENKIVQQMKTKRKLENQAVHLQTKSFEEKTDIYDKELDKLHKQTNQVDKTISNLIQQQHEYYNPSWGRVFRTGAEESYFAYQVDRYACIYMEKLLDLLEHSPLTYFRANRRLLAHDLDNILD